MPELRYNLATKEWIILSTERAKRPEDFPQKPAELSKDSAANCPFCEGHEQKTPQEIFAIRDEHGWKVRVTPNAFPALSPKGEPSNTTDQFGFTKMNGIGIHEVIIESPEHEQIIATMDPAQVEAIYTTYKERYSALSKDPRFKSIILFKNHGQHAGTSLHHPHSQIIATPVVPRIIRDRIEIAESFYKEKNLCLYCNLINTEKAAKERIIFESDNFVVFAPFASRFPFEMWVLPKKHASHFEEIENKVLMDLAHVMQTILKKLYKVLNNPDFNYAIYSAPCQEKNLPYIHWNIKVFPRLTMQAGFEVGSGMAINTVIPESAAKYLREA